MCVCVPDGLLYCSPFNASSVLVIDPCSRTLRFIEGAEEGGLKYFGICAGPDGMLYCAATAASSVLVIDPRTQTLSFTKGAVGSGLKWWESTGRFCVVWCCVCLFVCLLAC